MSPGTRGCWVHPALTLLVQSAGKGSGVPNDENEDQWQTWGGTKIQEPVSCLNWSRNSSSFGSEQKLGYKTHSLCFPAYTYGRLSTAFDPGFNIQMPFSTFPWMPPEICVPLSVPRTSLQHTLFLTACDLQSGMISFLLWKVRAGLFWLSVSSVCVSQTTISCFSSYKGPSDKFVL